MLSRGSAGGGVEMGELFAQKVGPKKEWNLTPGAFDRLLTWLDQGSDSGGQRYLEMQRRLAAFFDRKNCQIAEELADETLNRVARRLEEEEGIIQSETPAQYCYTLARFVFLEYLRNTQKTVPVTDAHPPITDHTLKSDMADAAEIKEKRLSCLEECVMKLSSANRHLILTYYTGMQKAKIQGRRELAGTLGITMNALSIRACRIRDKLEACVRECMNKN